MHHQYLNVEVIANENEICPTSTSMNLKKITVTYQRRDQKIKINFIGLFFHRINHMPMSFFCTSNISSNSSVVSIGKIEHILRNLTPKQAHIGRKPVASGCIFILGSSYWGRLEGISLLDTFC